MKAAYARIIIDIYEDGEMLETDELALSDEVNRLAENVERFIKTQRLIGATAKMHTE